MLQLNWLLSGVVVVEVFFQYAGFGKLLLDAALYNGDIYVIVQTRDAGRDVFVAVLLSQMYFRCRLHLSQSSDSLHT